jgi:DNA-directed RNA polymerase subunit RPC12/RpoP
MDSSLVGVLDVRVLVCAECGGEQPFAQPPCPDGHEQCPEWACTDCGFAIFLDPVIPDHDRAVAPGPAPARATAVPHDVRDIRPHAAHAA